MLKKSGSSVRLYSYADDQPHEVRGSLIPRRTTSHPKHTFTPAAARPFGRTAYLRAAVALVGLFVFAVLGTTGYGLWSQANVAAAPTVTIVNPYTERTTALEYGPQLALAQQGFFTETQNGFIEAGLTFISADLVSRQLRFFKKGVLLQSAEIQAVGKTGSWWETPAGLYKVTAKDEYPFSNLGQVHLPWQLTFQENYVMHGTPTYPDGSAANDAFKGGGVTLTDAAAKTLYREVRLGTPVLVHSQKNANSAVFVYEPQVPTLDTPHYFIADIENSTILASTDRTAEAPIASLVKLMTAVVAAEQLDLDGQVQVTAPTFVTSLVPRLSGRNSVSMYSLLQLLLVESSNEAAETIAGELGREAFIAAMNDKARQLGMMHTHFADPSGLSAENVSTIGDLYQLAKYIRENRSFIFEITAHEKPAGTAVGGDFSGLVNFNEVEDMDSFVGGKVGETRAAGQTSISLHELEFQGTTRTLVVILLGSEDRTEDIEALLSYVQDRFGR